MKTWFALLLVAMFLPLASPADSQTAPTPAPAAPTVATPVPIQLLADGTGDVQVNAQGTPEGANGRWAAADLVGLTVTESADTFAFALKVGNLKASPEAPFAEATSYYVHFLVRDRIYQVVMFRALDPTGAPFYFSNLRAYDPGRNAYYTLENNGQITADADLGLMTATYPRDLFVDTDGTAPMPELPFTNWHVAATSNINTQGCNIGFGPVPSTPCPTFVAIDRMPDAGNGTLTFPIVLGAVQTGTARLSSLIPTRTSNGEATTFVFQVTANNLGDRADTFSLTNSAPPAGWEAKLPAPHIDIPAGGKVVFPVLVTTPFQHTHGTLQHFQVEMRSLSDDSSVGRLQLGVRYAQPPQPAGHHNQLYLHSEDLTGTDPANTVFSTAFNGGPFTAAFMNAEPTDKNDAGVGVEGQFNGFNLSPTPVSYYEWTIPLSPGLELGLDFDVNAACPECVLAFPIKTTQPLTAATFSGEIVHYSAPNRTSGNNRGISLRGQGDDGRVQTVVAKLLRSAPMDIPVNSAGNQIKLVVKALPEGDYVAYQKGASLELHLNMSFTGADPTFVGPAPRPMLEPGGVLQLPLLEYHDQVDQIFASSTVALVANGAQDRVLNPGKSALYNLTIENNGNDTATFKLDLSGTNAQWSHMLTPTGDVRLAAGAKAAVAVVVTAPTASKQGDAADLVLSATRADDLNVRSLARLFATVDTKADHPDDMPAISGLDEQLHPKKSSPGLELLPLVAALAAMVLVQRRRRA